MTNASTCHLPVSEIRLQSSLQPRCDGLIEDHVAALTGTPEAWPPIIVAREADAYVLVDGFHRFEAARRLGIDTIAATVVEAPLGVDLLHLAFELNIAHGLRLSLKDRKAYAMRLLAENPQLSDREIGRRSGADRETVSRLRRGNDGGGGVPERKAGEIDADIGLFDPIRFARKASRPQKAIAGYLKRLVVAMGDPYDDEKVRVEGWSDDPFAIAQACFATLGPARATELLGAIAYHAHFLAQIGNARKPILKSHDIN